jgi:DNA-binding NtrC family response regulator
MYSLFAWLADFFRWKKGRTTWLWRSPADRSALGPITVIGLISSEVDRRLLAGICSRSRWNLLFVHTCEEARIALHKLKAPVVLCDRDLPGREWRGTVGDLASSPHRACIILVSGVVDTYLWNEVVRTGGFDVLSKPLREDEVIRAVRLAWSYWNSAQCRVIGGTTITRSPDHPILASVPSSEDQANQVEQLELPGRE